MSRNKSVEAQSMSNIRKLFDLVSLFDKPGEPSPKGPPLDPKTARPFDFANPTCVFCQRPLIFFPGEVLESHIAGEPGVDRTYAFSVLCPSCNKVNALKGYGEQVQLLFLVVAEQGLPC
jgi:hypothetical protein